MDPPAQVKTIRDRLGETQQGIADRLGVTVRTVNRWENGKTPVPATALRALKALRKRKHPTKEQPR